MFERVEGVAFNNGGNGQALDQRTRSCLFAFCALWRDVFAVVVY